MSGGGGVFGVEFAFFGFRPAALLTLPILSVIFAIENFHVKNSRAPPAGHGVTTL